MLNHNEKRGRRSERGEGNIKLIIVLLLASYAGYCGVKNIPIYFDVKNMIYDVDELARTNGAQGISLEKVKPQGVKLAQKYNLEPQAVVVTKDGPNLTVKLKTEKELDFLFTKRKWEIDHVATGQKM